MGYNLRMDEAEKKPEKLTRKQRAFIDAYLAGPSRFNATASAKEAGYSEKTAYSIGYELLRKPEISAEIERRLDEVKLSKAAVLGGLADIANGDMADFMEITPMGWDVSLLLHDENGDLIRDENGRPVRNPKTKLIKRLKQKVTTITSKDGEEKEIIETDMELYSAHEAYRDMGKHYKLFGETIALTNGDGSNLIPDVEEVRSEILGKLAGLAASLGAGAIPAEPDSRPTDGD